ncbi:MAG: hypothetical protein Kow0027_27700 [Saprospiraceae bacterium]
MIQRKIIFAALLFAALPGWVLAQIPLAEEKVVVTNERRVNSDELEFSPVFYKDGIVFITSRFETVQMNVKDKNIGSKNIFSIYRSRRDSEGFLQEPTPFANELMFRLHEGPLAFDRTGQRIYFTRNEPKTVAADGFKKLQIYTAVHDSIKWDSLEKLRFNDPNFNYLHPTVSPDDDLMIIASDLPGGYGGMDLYAVVKEDGKWSKLVNLGGTVNTIGNEVFPYLAADGTLYFSSDGHGGFGNLDIFYTQRQLGEWMAPVNLGIPFNSPSDDFGFIVDRDNKNGYFSSDRKGGFGEDDIYSFYIEGDSRPIAGAGRGLEDLVVKDAVGNPMSGAQIKAIHMDEIAIATDSSGIVRLLPAEDDPQRFVLDVSPDNLGNEGLTDDAGKTNIALRQGNYVVKVSKEGYLPEYIVVGPETDLSQKEIRLTPAAQCVTVSGVVSINNGRTPVSGATVSIVDIKTKERITIFSDERGYYEYCVPCNRSYTVYATRNNASTEPGTISTSEIPCRQNSMIDMPLTFKGAPLYAGMTIVLPNIYFNFDDDKLRPDAYKDLDEVVAMMKGFPGMRLELASHTDSRGDKAYNLDLSRRRSLSVKKYLVEHGVEDDRLIARGYGESQLRNHCSDGVACSEEEHQLNRRTEIKIIEMGEDMGPEESDLLYAQEEESQDPNFEKGGQEEGVPVKTSEELPEVIDESDAPAEGTFIVIAGTFANYENATRRLQALMTMGYNDALIVKQARNGLFAVWANRVDDKSAAFDTVRKLAAQQINAYVRKR